MIIQAVISQMITQIAATIGNGIEGAGLAIKDATGKVISNTNPNDFAGLDDRKGNYFYFRLNGNITQNLAARNPGSCGKLIVVRVPVKMVIQHRCQSAQDLVDVAQFALYSVDFSGIRWGYDISIISIIPVGMNFVPWQVYAGETGKKELDLISEMQLASVDFSLEITYSYSTKCVDYKLC